MSMDFMDRADWAEDHGYYHWKCKDCGMSGWTDTTPDCACRVPEETYSEEGIDILTNAQNHLQALWQPGYYYLMDYETYKDAYEILQGCIDNLSDRNGAKGSLDNASNELL